VVLEPRINKTNSNFSYLVQLQFLTSLPRALTAIFIFKLTSPKKALKDA